MVGTYVFTHALRDFARVRRLLVWALVAVVFYGIGMAYVRVNEGTSRQDTYVLLSAMLSYRVLALSAAIFASAVVAQEVEGRTIVYLLTRPIKRQILLLGRVLAASLVVYAVSVVSAVAVSYATMGSNNPLLGKDFVALGIGALAYTGLFTLLSLVINRAMVVSLLFAFGWETLALGVPGDLKLLTLNTHLLTVANRPAPNNDMGVLDGMIGSSGLPVNVSWMILLGVAALSILGSMAWFAHFEFVAREDAE